jgi:aspartyl-tRNA(Asn)/glutamyl-tRNA(Gln) amidotransferase subunit C
MLDIKKYEAMAKLDLPDDERTRIADEIGHWVERFAVLQKTDTTGVEPLVSVLEQRYVMRDDIVQKQFSRGDMLSNAPEQYNGYFQVPKTVEA